jgi:hypothetical protein
MLNLQYWEKAKRGKKFHSTISNTIKIKIKTKITAFRDIAPCNLEAK